jgi:signal transduction histidine kinase
VVNGNAFLLTQLFTNLIDNSIKFAKENEPLIIDITWSEKGKNKVVISLKDNGQGFENKYAENMFKVFHRLNDSGSKEGSGVGLAICKKVVELHGGEISAQGIENKGATFNVTLLLPEN